MSDHQRGLGDCLVSRALAELAAVEAMLEATQTEHARACEAFVQSQARRDELERDCENLTLEINRKEDVIVKFEARVKELEEALRRQVNR